MSFIPKQYANLRTVEGYDRLILERFERCLDLYLQPRLRKRKLDIDPNSLIPRLPDIQSLRPFPCQKTIEYQEHKHRIRCICVLGSGQYMASGDDSGLVLVWDVLSARVLVRVKMEYEIMGLDFSPDS